MPLTLRIRRVTDSLRMLITSKRARVMMDLINAVNNVNNTNTNI